MILTYPLATAVSTKIMPEAERIWLQQRLAEAADLLGLGMRVSHDLRQPPDT